MGLDQYLQRKLYIQQWDHHPEDTKFHLTLTRGGKVITLTNPTYIEDEVGYWRKANQIHLWFVENVQNGEDNCEDAYVTIEQLTELRDLCVQVRDNPEKAPELLPTGSGFFFGSQEYDEWYMKDITNTITILNKVIEEDESYQKDKIFFDYYYQSSW